MRILWLSNAPWAPSGYGEQTALFTERFRDAGHDVAIAANFGLQMGSFEWHGIPVYSANINWGNPTIETFAKHHQADIVIALCDAQVMDPKQWPDLQMAIWAPVDHEPVPSPVAGVLGQLNVQAIAMSRNGEKWLQPVDPLYVPHGVDTAIFNPRPQDRAGVRKLLGIPEDAFLIGMVAANKSDLGYARKGFPQAFDAFSRFARKHKDAYLHVHTMAAPRGAGINLYDLSFMMGCPDDRVSFPADTGWDLGLYDRLYLSYLYQAFDVLLNPSWGEGFGVPIIEAQACGIPVIASRHSAMTELVEHTGWLVTGDRFYTQAGSFALLPSVDSVEVALEAAYDDSGNQERSAKCVQHAQTYDADRVMERYWSPTLEALAKPREVPPLNGKKTRQVRRAEERKAAKAAA